jgi:hypothetical protein
MKSSTGVLVGFVVIVGGLDDAAFADAWTGASASASIHSQSQSQQGATANAVASGSYTDNYLGSPAFQYPTYFQATVAGNLTASAGGDPSNLLSVTASSNSPNPGTLGDGIRNDGGTAAASWTNDAAIVTAPVGSNLPGAIRLNFALTFTTPSDSPYSNLTATYNGTNLSYSGMGYMYGYSMGIYPGTSNAAAVDSSTILRDADGKPDAIKDTFHIDLPLNMSGLSAPFSLGLQLSPFIGLLSNANVSYSGLTGNIALTSVTLPDGTPLSALGDSVSFESGLILPTAAPEPSSVLVWGLAAVAVVTAVRRSRATSPVR